MSNETKEVVIETYHNGIVFYDLIIKTRKLKGYDTYVYTQNSIEDEVWVKGLSHDWRNSMALSTIDMGDTYKGDLRENHKFLKHEVATNLDVYREDKDFIKTLKNNPEYLVGFYEIAEIPTDYKYYVDREGEYGESLYAGKDLLIF